MERVSGFFPGKQGAEWGSLISDNEEGWLLAESLFLEVKWENFLIFALFHNYRIRIKLQLCHQKLSVQSSPVAQSCPTLCDPMNRSMPGLPVYQHLPGFTQTHVHRIRNAIQPSHPLSSPSSPAPKRSQHQSLFQ